MKKRDIVTNLQKVCDLTRPTLLKLTKSDLIKMYNKFTSSDTKEEQKESGKKPREKKQRLLDFSSDEEEEEKEHVEEEKTDKVVKPVAKPVVKPVVKPVKKVKVKEPEPELKLDEPEPEPEPEPVKVKPVKVKAKKVNEIKLEIKELLKSFKDEVSKIILQFKKDNDSDYLIDSYNELRTEAEQEVSEILDENKSKVSESLLDYVDGLIDVQKRRVERLLE